MAEPDLLLCGSSEKGAAPNGERENRFIGSAQSMVRRVYNGRAIRIKRKDLSKASEADFSNEKQKRRTEQSKVYGNFFDET